MPPQLPWSYKFKFFYSNRNLVVMDVPLIVDDHNVVFSSHVLFPSSSPLFSPIVIIIQIEMMKILLCL